MAGRGAGRAKAGGGAGGGIAPEDLPQALAAGLKPVYLITGPEALLRHEAVAAVLDAAIPQAADRAMACQEFTCPEKKHELRQLEPAKIVDELSIPPFLGGAERKVAVLRQAGAWLQENQDAFLRFLEDPPETAVLVIEAASFRKDLRVSKRIAQIGTIVDHKALYATAFGSSNYSADSSLGRAVRMRARQRGVNLTDEALLAMFEVGGTELGALDAALEKIALMQGPVGGKKALGAREVLEMVVGTSAGLQFEIVDRLFFGQVVKCVLQLKQIFQEGLAIDGKWQRSEGGIAMILLAMFNRRQGQLETAATLRREGRDSREITRLVGVWRSQEVFLRSLNHWSPPALADMAEAIYESEWNIKSGRMDNLGALEGLAIRAAEILKGAAAVRA
ncbi:MAG: DNA polymerase III subunit delta [Planctomycetota bacterium]